MNALALIMLDESKAKGCRSIEKEEVSSFGTVF
jgi:hypothetical protein